MIKDKDFYNKESEKYSSNAIEPFDIIFTRGFIL